MATKASVKRQGQGQDKARVHGDLPSKSVGKARDSARLAQPRWVWLAVSQSPALQFFEPFRPAFVERRLSLGGG